MTTTRLLGAAAVAALLSGSAWAQTPAPPAETPRPAAVAPTPPVATPADPATGAPAVTPPASSIVTPPATTPAPATPAVTPMAAAPATPAAGQLVAKGDIIDTLKANGHFKTFLKALETANMTNVLKTNKNLTVFAPTDAAFAALPAGELDRLMKSPAELQKLLTYHVINATVDSAKIKGAKGGVKTVAGSELMLDGSGAGLMANNAAIVQSDVMAANGTVHVVDKVLMPGSTVAATTGATTDAAATAPAAPETPKPATPAESMPTTPPTQTEPAAPEAPKGPDTPPQPQG